MSALMRYVETLKTLPPSGGGGAHTAILRCANLGKLSGLAPEQIAKDLAAHVHGARKISRLEINEAVAKAFQSAPPQRHTSRVRVNGPKLMAHILERGRDFTLKTVGALSPVQITWQPECDFIEVLSRLYAPDDKLFCGSRYDGDKKHIRTVRDWIARWEHGDITPEHIVPNPLTGGLGLTKSGKSSFRADACVAKFPFTVIEFDNLSIERQIQFFGGAKLNVSALIHSGGKSIHAWVRTDVTSATEWTLRIEEQLFDILTAVGVDGTSRNESRLSRTPGHFRADKGNFQRLLYLDPTGAPLQP